MTYRSPHCKEQDRSVREQSFQRDRRGSHGQVLGKFSHWNILDVRELHCCGVSGGLVVVLLVVVVLVNVVGSTMR